MKSTRLAILLLFTLLLTNSFAQRDYSFFGAVKNLSLYLTSKEFTDTRGKLSDPQRMDSIFKQALKLTPSVSEALLVATFATLPFKHFPFVTPVFKTRINIPLPVGPLKIFDKKITFLPSRLFFDSPQTKSGDVDKLAHYFANAFLVYNFNRYEISDFMGILIELFEKNFKVHGFIDAKDLTINHLGAIFGKALRQNKNVLPSDFLVLYNLLFFQLNLL